MSVVRYRDVLHAVLHLMGRNPDSGDFSPEEARMITSFVNLRMQRAWTWTWWPELMRAEHMTFRPLWRADTTYAKGEEVFYASGSLYYRAVRETANELPETSDAWEVIVYLNTYIPYRHPNYEPIGHVHYVTDRDPDHTGRWRTYSFTLTRQGVKVLDKSVPALVWVRYRVPVPMYSAEEVDPMKGYPAGAVVYGPDGHCYQATANVEPGEELWELDSYGNIQAGADEPQQLWELDEGGNIQPTIIYQQFTDKWQRIQFPQFLFSPIVRAAYADYLRAKGQGDKAAVDDRQFAEELLHMADLLPQQAQVDYVIT
jgi:hypothetical protein